MTALPPRETWDSLPEASFGRRQQIIDGETVWVPFSDECEAVWLDEDQPPGWTDTDGIRWRFVKMGGKWAKRRWF